MSSQSPLRSPYEKVGLLVYFGRMLDKIRQHAEGKLPPEYVANLGDSRPRLFDARSCRFLGVTFADLQTRVIQGGTDEEILAWAQEKGIGRSDEDCETWSRFLMKIGWRDDRSQGLRERVRELGLEGKQIETFFDLIDTDEGRDPVATEPWAR